MELTQRKKQILKIVVDSYINTAEPVGSKAIVALMPEKERAGRPDGHWLPGAAPYLGGAHSIGQGLPAVRQRADGPQDPVG